MKDNIKNKINVVLEIIFLIVMIALIGSCMMFVKSQQDINMLEAELADNQVMLQAAQEDLSIVQENYNAEIEKSIRLNNELTEMTEKLNSTTLELEVANKTIADLKGSEYKLVYIGDFKLTHYCTEKREHICGTGTGLTATGTKVTAGRTVAVDPSVIPYGTKIYIEGYGWRVAEDCGGAVKKAHIDIAVESHSQALSLGQKSGGVWILVKNS